MQNTVQAEAALASLEGWEASHIPWLLNRIEDLWLSDTTCCCQSKALVRGTEPEIKSSKSLGAILFETCSHHYQEVSHYFQGCSYKLPDLVIMSGQLVFISGKSVIREVSL